MVVRFSEEEFRGLDVAALRNWNSYNEAQSSTSWIVPNYAKLSHVTEFYVIGHMAGDLRWPDTGQEAYFWREKRFRGERESITRRDLRGHALGTPYSHVCFAVEIMRRNRKLSNINTTSSKAWTGWRLATRRGKGGVEKADLSQFLAPHTMPNCVTRDTELRPEQIA